MFVEAEEFTGETEPRFEPDETREEVVKRPSNDGAVYRLYALGRVFSPCGDILESRVSDPPTATRLG